jgi:O-antigen ligase
MLATIIPMIAASLSLFRGKPDRLLFHRSLSIALAGLVIPLILMTGSRMGVVLAAAGGVLALWVYRAPQSVGRVEGVRSEHRTRLVGLGVGGLLLVLVGVIAARSPALERLFGTDPASELRLQAFPVVLTDVWNYFPVGSGFGTFVETYQISEPASLISERYFNHAHNDFLELVLTGGLAGVLLLVWAVAMGAIAFRSLLRGRRTARDDPNFSPQVLGRTGFSILAIFALASLTDYPLRVPSLMLCAVVAVVWCLNAVKNTRDDA